MRLKMVKMTLQENERYPHKFTGCGSITTWDINEYSFDVCKIMAKFNCDYLVSSGLQDEVELTVINKDGIIVNLYKAVKQ